MVEEAELSFLASKALFQSFVGLWNSISERNSALLGIISTLTVPEETLNYRSARDDTHHRNLSARQICLRLLLLLGTIVIGWIVLIGPTGAQIQLNTGDLRYTYFGIPGDTNRTLEPERTTILTLAAGSTVLKPEWVSVPYDPAHGAHRFIHHEFYRAASWATVNSQIAKQLLEDLVRRLKKPQPPGTIPSLELPYLAEPTGPGTWKLLDPSVEQQAVAYLKSKGLPIPSTAPSATTAPATVPPKG